VFENRILRRIFGRKWEELMGGWRTLHSVELHNLHSSPSVIRVIKSMLMRLEEYVRCMGELWNTYKVWSENSKGRKDLGAG
jgi:hypothetical protein